MSEGVPMIAYLDGVPLGDVPRETLERFVGEMAAENDRLRRELAERKMLHIGDLARMAATRGAR